MQERLKVFWDFSRPFTNLAPALGMLSGGITAFGAAPPQHLSPTVFFNLIVGTLMAAVLNAGSNGLNQIYDLDVDRVNKPHRPLPSGKLTLDEAHIFTWTAFALGLVFAWTINWQCFVLAFLATIFTIGYSVPPLRTKARGIWANITISIPRGVLLKVAGWSTIKTVIAWEPWFIGLIFGLFLLGAASTKDFADMKGDRAGGCRTLPIIYGVKRAAYLISPSFILPFLLIPLGVSLGVLTGNAVALKLLGFGLAFWGLYVVLLILRDPEALAKTENHPSWTHMYLMMVTAQVGFMIAYLL